MKLTLLAIALCLCLSTFVQAGEKEYFELAMKFEQLSSSSDKNQLIKQIFPALKSNLGLSSSQEHDEILKKYLVNILQSREYEEGKARVYMSLYSKNELELLIKLVSSPEYELLQSKRGAIAAGLIQNMNNQFQKTLPSLQSEIKKSK